MSAIIRVTNLIDQHGESFTDCEGCHICNEIKNLRKELNKNGVPKGFKHILAKGEDMTRSDIATLLEGEVPKNEIKKALKINKDKFVELLRNFGLERGYEKKSDMGVVDVEITAKEYYSLKGKGMKDTEIAEKKGVNPNTLRNWKYHNRIKAFKKAEQPKLKGNYNSETKPTKEDQEAEYRQLINELSTALNDEKKSGKEKDTLIEKLEAKVSELENIHAACDDVESEVASLKKERDNYRDQLLDTRDKLIKQDYVVENQKKSLEHAKTTLERYELENKHMRGLLSVWI
ncbi:hypothetical protein [Cytobacillus praedii]|uniref:hypothetical protein n=1 Tax=Cytobacillus praedii TaxID=1742358 RepID=UPI00070AF629|nr:hypothetical protein [Cytobacillus praedii]